MTNSDRTPPDTMAAMNLRLGVIAEQTRRSADYSVKAYQLAKFNGRVPWVALWFSLVATLIATLTACGVFQ